MTKVCAVIAATVALMVAPKTIAGIDVPAPSYPVESPTFRAVTGPGYLQAIQTNPCVGFGNCPDNGNVWITNLSAVRSNGQVWLTFGIAGGSNGVAYDVFAGGTLSKPLSDSDWTWIGQGYQNVTYSMPAFSDASPLYLLLGSPLDSDGDGLTDAYELLVSHSNPYVSNSINASALDGWSVAYDLNPLAIYDQQGFPGDPYVRLDYWKFNTNTYQSQSGLLPVDSMYASLSADWSGEALSDNTPALWLSYPSVGAAGPSFNPNEGTIRFWYMPYYGPGTLGGAGEYGNFFQFGTGQNTWTFGMQGYETQLGCSVSGNVFCSFFEPQTNSFQLQSNLWCQFVVAYSPTNIAIYTNGTLFITGTRAPTSNNLPVFALGNGVNFAATPASQAAGFSIGNNNYKFGFAPSEGLIDEFETFNYPLSPQAVCAGFPGFVGASNNIMTDSDYDGRSDMLETLVDGTNPNDPTKVVQCRLGYWQFDVDNLMADQGQLPLSYYDVSLVPSWSGTALNISSDPASQVTYWDVYTNGWANINCRQGCLRFWFKPNWNGQPASAAPFVYLGNTNPASSQWALGVNANGAITLTTTSNSVTQTPLTSAPLSFNSGQWMQIVLNYGSNGTTLYTNGVLAASGGPVTLWPGLADRNLGMVIGNNAAHNNSINGQFDEMETFNYQVDSGSILTNFQAVQAIDSNLDGVPDVMEDIVLPVGRPYLGWPVVVTGTIEAEEFDMGGPGVGYYAVSNNPPSAYRPTGLYITNCDDRGLGYCLDRTRAGEWAQYTINVLVAETYNIEARVEGIGSNGIFECEFTNTGFYTNTGPLTITSTNWTNVSAPVFLTNGVYTMKLRFLTNGSDGRHVGKFNYISIYPWWPMGFVSTQTNVVTAQELSTNNDFLDASNNAAVIQQAINTLPASGGTVLLPAGTYYVSQAAPNETNDDYQNAAFNVVTNNIEIAGAGKTNTTLIAYNRVTTILSYGQNPQLYVQCSNFVLRDLTLQAQPHLAVFNVTNTIYEQGEFRQPYIGRNYYTGFLTVFKGYSTNMPDNNIVISNCQFRYADFSIGTVFHMSNCIITHCDFNIWGGTNIYTGATNNYPTNTANTIGYDGSVGIFGAGAPNYNMVIVDNNYNGNTNLMPSTNNALAYAITNTTQLFGPDGFVYFQSGGNFFIGRNNIANYELEAVQSSSGPNDVTGNNYSTLINCSGACAFAINRSGFLSILGNNFINYSSCFIGNQIYGGRNGISPQGINMELYSVNCSGNDLAVYPPIASGDYPGALASLSLCQWANIAGNTLEAGGHGALFNAPCGSAVIMNNNFANASYRSIGLGILPGSLLDGSLNSALIVGNVLGQGSTFHVQMPVANTFNYFLYGNQYLNTNGVSIAPFLNPPGSAAHVSD